MRLLKWPLVLETLGLGTLASVFYFEKGYVSQSIAFKFRRDAPRAETGEDVRGLCSDRRSSRYAQSSLLPLRRRYGCRGRNGAVICREVGGGNIWLRLRFVGHVDQAYAYYTRIYAVSAKLHK